MKVLYLKDVELIFNKNNTALDPCHGLTEFGPYGINEFRTIKVGLVGSAESILQVEYLLMKLKTKIIDNNTKKWPFPGLGKNSNLKIEIDLRYKEMFNDKDLMIFNNNKSSSRIDRIGHALNLIEPDVIIISIPKEILKSCRSKEFKYTTRIYIVKRQFDLGLENVKEGYNFHHIIKVIGMKYGLPTQLIYPNTLTPNPKVKGKQDLAVIAWNLTVALLYKANEVPWKYFGFPENTCFVGISFHKEFDDNDKQITRASVAQTFLSDGKDIVLRGKRFEWDRLISNNPHMNKEYTIGLMEEILLKYKEHWNKFPERVVIHKSSEYWPDEAKGFEIALKEVNKVDLITLLKTDVRFYRLEQQPIVRGTFINLFGRYYLYNVGYIPCLEEYPGARIPSPIEIKFFRNNEDKIKICKEIMALARLNWNNIDYSTKYPVTLTFSRRAGEILSEYRAKSLKLIPDKYRYYM